MSDSTNTTVIQRKGHFYGVYLLCSQSIDRRYHGKCYIGFTVNPKRRIKQHNRGREFGGAKKTSNKGPWEMVMIVHGFPNNIVALQFEWAWQQPTLSTRLKQLTDLQRKLPKETYFQYHFRILSRMLNVGPWQRLPLVIRWLEPGYECDFPPDVLPPRHMQIVSGRVAISKNPSNKHKIQEKPKIWAPECHLCLKRIMQTDRSRVGCLNTLCKLTCHLICLANYLIASDKTNRGHYIPISGECPLCETLLSWAELLLLRRMQIAGVIDEGASNEEDEDASDLSADDLDVNSDASYEEDKNCDIYEISD